MTLRQALKQSGWEAFKNSQNEEWNTDDLLNSVLEGESPQWLDAECTVSDEIIIDIEGDELSEIEDEQN